MTKSKIDQDIERYLTTLPHTYINSREREHSKHADAFSALEQACYEIASKLIALRTLSESLEASLKPYQELKL